jgi:hypothetical protein
MFVNTPYPDAKVELNTVAGGLVLLLASVAATKALPFESIVIPMI